MRHTIKHQLILEVMKNKKKNKKTNTRKRKINKTRSINEIAGTCFVCKRLICTQCLLTCDLTGAPVCQMHSTVKNGVVIGNHAKKGLWRFKVRRIREEKELGLDVRKQIPYK